MRIKKKAQDWLVNNDQNALLGKCQEAALHAHWRGIKVNLITTKSHLLEFTIVIYLFLLYFLQES
jgi:hypothetical protein